MFLNANHMAGSCVSDLIIFILSIFLPVFGMTCFAISHRSLQFDYVILFWFLNLASRLAKF